ncbi:MAG TPA: glycogen/starch synthase, partial [Candidatus Omnitrophota bacterium]|nr:glycogen/starch synthase [Candidatus Omnitrophota bacterium]
LKPASIERLRIILAESDRQLGAVNGINAHYPLLLSSQVYQEYSDLEKAQFTISFSDNGFRITSISSLSSALEECFDDILAYFNERMQQAGAFEGVGPCEVSVVISPDMLWICETNVKSKTLSIHPHFFSLPDEGNAVILYHELFSHIIRGHDTDDIHALTDTVEFLNMPCNADLRQSVLDHQIGVKPWLRLLAGDERLNVHMIRDILRRLDFINTFPEHGTPHSIISLALSEEGFVAGRGVSIVRELNVNRLVISFEDMVAQDVLERIAANIRFHLRMSYRHFEHVFVDSMNTIVVDLGAISFKNLTEHWRILDIPDFPLDHEGNFRCFTSEEIYKMLTKRAGEILISLRNQQASQGNALMAEGTISHFLDGLYSALFEGSLDNPFIFTELQRLEMALRMLQAAVEETGHTFSQADVNIRLGTKIVYFVPNELALDELVKLVDRKLNVSLGYYGRYSVTCADRHLTIDLSYARKSLQDLQYIADRYVEMVEKMNRYAPKAAKRIYFARQAGAIAEMSYYNCLLRGSECKDYVFAVSKDTIGLEGYLLVMHEVTNFIYRRFGAEEAYDLSDIERLVIQHQASCYKQNEAFRALVDRVYGHLRSSGLLGDVVSGDTILVADEVSSGTYIYFMKFVIEQKMREEGKDVTVLYYVGGVASREMRTIYFGADEKQLPIVTDRSTMDKFVRISGDQPHVIRINLGEDNSVRFSIEEPVVLLGSYLRSLIMYNALVEYYKGHGRSVRPVESGFVHHGDRKVQFDMKADTGVLAIPCSSRDVSDHASTEDGKLLSAQAEVEIIRSLHDLERQGRMPSLNAVERAFFMGARKVSMLIGLYDFADMLTEAQEEGLFVYAPPAIDAILRKWNVFAYRWIRYSGEERIFIRNQLDPDTMVVTLVHEAGALLGLPHAINNIFAYEALRHVSVEKDAIRIRREVEDESSPKGFAFQKAFERARFGFMLGVEIGESSFLLILAAVTMVLWVNTLTLFLQGTMTQSGVFLALLIGVVIITRNHGYRAIELLNKLGAYLRDRYFFVMFPGVCDTGVDKASYGDSEFAGGLQPGRSVSFVPLKSVLSRMIIIVTVAVLLGLTGLSSFAQAAEQRVYAVFGSHQTAADFQEVKPWFDEATVRAKKTNRLIYIYLEEAMPLDVKTIAKEAGISNFSIDVVRRALEDEEYLKYLYGFVVPRYYNAADFLSKKIDEINHGIKPKTVGSDDPLPDDFSTRRLEYIFARAEAGYPISLRWERPSLATFRDTLALIDMQAKRKEAGEERESLAEIDLDTRLVHDDRERDISDRIASQLKTDADADALVLFGAGHHTALVQELQKDGLHVQDRISEDGLAGEQEDKAVSAKLRKLIVDSDKQRALLAQARADVRKGIGRIAAAVLFFLGLSFVFKRFFTKTPAVYGDEDEQGDDENEPQDLARTQDGKPLSPIEQRALQELLIQHTDAIEAGACVDSAPVRDAVRMLGDSNFRKVHDVLEGAVIIRGPPELFTEFKQLTDKTLLGTSIPGCIIINPLLKDHSESFFCVVIHEAGVLAGNTHRENLALEQRFTHKPRRFSSNKGLSAKYPLGISSGEDIVIINDRHIRFHYAVRVEEGDEVEMRRETYAVRAGRSLRYLFIHEQGLLSEAIARMQAGILPQESLYLTDVTDVMVTYECSGGNKHVHKVVLMDLEGNQALIFGLFIAFKEPVSGKRFADAETLNARTVSDSGVTPRFGGEFKLYESDSGKISTTPADFEGELYQELEFTLEEWIEGDEVRTMRNTGVFTAEHLRRLIFAVLRLTDVFAQKYEEGNLGHSGIKRLSAEESLHRLIVPVDLNARNIMFRRVKNSHGTVVHTDAVIVDLGEVRRLPAVALLNELMRQYVMNIPGGVDIICSAIIDYMGPARAALFLRAVVVRFSSVHFSVDVQKTITKYMKEAERLTVVHELIGVLQARVTFLQETGTSDETVLGASDINSYPLLVPADAQKRYSQEFGANGVIGEVTGEGIELSSGAASLRGDFNTILTNRLAELAQISSRAPPSWNLIVTTDVSFTNGMVAACTIDSATVYLHPYFFALPEAKQREILYHELNSHLYKGICDEVVALRDTRAGLWLNSRYPAVAESLVVSLSMEGNIPEFEGYDAQNACTKGGLGAYFGDKLEGLALVGIPAYGIQPGYSKVIKQGVTVDVDYSELIAKGILQRVVGLDGQPLTLNVYAWDSYDPDNMNKNPLIEVTVWQLNRGGTLDFLLMAPVFDVLYTDNRAHRFTQEIVFGKAAYQLMKSLAIIPDILHLNEAHTVVAAAQVRADESFNKTAIVYTNHTLVPAGLEMFYAGQLKTSVERMMYQVGLPEAKAGEFKSDFLRPSGIVDFCYAAMHLADAINAVSDEHAIATEILFHQLYNAEFDKKVVGVLNGSGKTWKNQALVTIEESGRYASQQELVTIHGQGKHEALTEVASRSSRMLDEHMPTAWAVRRLVDYKSQYPMLRFLVHIMCADLDRAFTRDELRSLWHRDIPDLATDYNQYLVEEVLNGMFKDRDIVYGLGMQMVVAGPEYMPFWVSEFKQWSELPELKGRFIYVSSSDARLLKMQAIGADICITMPRPLEEACGTSDQRTGLNGGVTISIGGAGPVEWVVDGVNGFLLDSYTKEAASGLVADNARFYREAPVDILHKLEISSRLYYTECNAWEELMHASYMSANATVTAEAMERRYAERVYGQALQARAGVNNPYPLPVSPDARQQAEKESGADAILHGDFNFVLPDGAACLQVIGDNDGYKYLNPALLPDGALLARAVSRTQDTSIPHISTLVRLVPSFEDVATYVFDRVILENAEDPRVMSVGSRLGMTYVVPDAGGHTWHSYFVFISEDGTVCSSPVQLGRPGVNSKNTYLFELESGKIVMYDRANLADVKPSVQRYLFDSLEDVLNPPQGYWESHGVQENTIINAPAEFSLAGFNEIVDLPSSEYALGIIHFARIIDDHQKVYCPACVFLNRQTGLPVSDFLILVDPAQHQSLCSGDVEGVIYPTAAVVEGEKLLLFAGAGDNHMVRFGLDLQMLLDTLGSYQLSLLTDDEERNFYPATVPTANNEDRDATPAERVKIATAFGGADNYKTVTGFEFDDLVIIISGALNSPAAVVPNGSLFVNPNTLRGPPEQLRVIFEGHELFHLANVTASEESAVVYTVDYLVRNDLLTSHIAYLTNNELGIVADATWLAVLECRAAGVFVEIMMHHNRAYNAWEKARLAGVLNKGALLIHIDSHDDLNMPLSLYGQPKTTEEAEQVRYNIDTFIIPAVMYGLVDEIWIVVSPFTNISQKEEMRSFITMTGDKKVAIHRVRIEELPDFAGETRDILLDIDLDYFALWSDFDDLGYPSAAIASFGDATPNVATVQETIARLNSDVEKFIAALDVRHTAAKVITIADSPVQYTPDPYIESLRIAVLTEIASRGIFGAVVRTEASTIAGFGET